MYSLISKISRGPIIAMGLLLGACSTGLEYHAVSYGQCSEERCPSSFFVPAVDDDEDDDSPRVLEFSQGTYSLSIHRKDTVIDGVSTTKFVQEPEPGSDRVSLARFGFLDKNRMLYRNCNRNVIRREWPGNAEDLAFICEYDRTIVLNSSKQQKYDKRGYYSIGPDSLGAMALNVEGTTLLELRFRVTPAGDLEILSLGDRTTQQLFGFTLVAKASACKDGGFCFQPAWQTGSKTYWPLSITWIAPDVKTDNPWRQYWARLDSSLKDSVLIHSEEISADSIVTW